MDQYPGFADDGDRQSLSAAVRQSLRFYQKQPPGRLFVFGRDSFTAREMADGMAFFNELLDRAPADFADQVKRNFLLYRSTGMPPEGAVVFSSYYEHDLKASLTKTGRYAYPLYGRPADVAEGTDASGKKTVHRRDGRPYFTRKEIDSDHALAGRGLEIAWAEDPVDVFFLQVQGSGRLFLPDGRRLRVRYAGNNGQPYRSVGGHLIETGRIPKASFSRATMVKYLADHPRERQALLNVNPRYVFFRIDRSDNQDVAFGSLNVPLTPYRSVATDPAIFPPGALAWMETRSKIKTARFVLNQDEGGAIKGPGRVDYFVGGGEAGEAYAVRFWETGRFYFLARRRGGTERGAP